MYLREYYVLKALFKPEYRGLYRKLWTVYSTLYPDIVTAVDGMTCPFCGKRYRSKNRLKYHLTRSCGGALAYTVKHAIDIYNRMPKPINGKYYINGKRYHREQLPKLVKELENTTYILK